MGTAVRWAGQVGGEESGVWREEIYWPQIPKASKFGHLSLYCQPYSQLVASSSIENWIKKKSKKVKMDKEWNQTGILSPPCSKSL